VSGAGKSADGGESQLQSFTPEAPTELTERCDLHPACGGGLDHLVRLQSRREKARGLEPRLDRRQDEGLTQLALRRLDQNGPPLGIDLAHPADVTAEVSGDDELGEDCLLEHRRVPHGHRAQGRDPLHQRRGKHQVAEPEPIPFLAWAATAAELGLGLALVLGLWPRLVALGSAVLLALSGLAMALSLGIKSPLDYSVFSASAAALLLAARSDATGRS
jgi:hypothetical protein